MKVTDELYKKVEENVWMVMMTNLKTPETKGYYRYPFTEETTLRNISSKQGAPKSAMVLEPSCEEYIKDVIFNTHLSLSDIFGVEVMDSPNERNLLLAEMTLENLKTKITKNVLHAMGATGEVKSLEERIEDAMYESFIQYSPLGEGVFWSDMGTSMEEIFNHDAHLFLQSLSDIHNKFNEEEGLTIDIKDLNIRNVFESLPTFRDTFLYCYDQLTGKKEKNATVSTLDEDLF